MAYTAHGHQIDGTKANELPVPSRIVRCGGPMLCAECARDCEVARQQGLVIMQPVPLEHPSLGNIGVRNSELEYQRKVLEVTRAYLQKLHDGTVDDPLVIVWFAKTLQNWKALVSFDPANGRYFEITYNGDREEAYVDEYRKVINRMIPLGG